jgi:hypothetical protein
MLFKIVAPIVADIYGDSFKDAVKNFIKINHGLNIHHMIVKDQTQHIDARIKYYQEDGRNKVGINMFPVGLGEPLPIITNNNKYLPAQIVQHDASNMLPILPGGVIGMPMLPTVINTDLRSGETNIQEHIIPPLLNSIMFPGSIPMSPMSPMSPISLPSLSYL